MKQKTWMALVLALALMLSLLAGCGSSSGTKDEAAMPQAAADETGSADLGGGENNAGVPRSEAKLIYRGSIEMETIEFDQAVEALKALVERCGAYVESSNLHNYDGSYRSAHYTVRVPVEHYREFYNGAGELCHVLRKDETTEDVTYAYYDTAGRLETQKTKLTRLQELLKQAESMEDIITIESAISETEHQIETLSGELRHYDDLVDYSTVELSLREVYKLSNTEGIADGYGSRLGAAFVTGWKNFVNGLENITVFLAHYLMWILLAAVVVILVRQVRKRMNKNEEAPRKFPFKPKEKPQNHNQPKT